MMNMLDGEGPKKWNKLLLLSEVGCLAMMVPLLSLSVAHSSLFDFDLFNSQTLFT